MWVAPLPYPQWWTIAGEENESKRAKRREDLKRKNEREAREKNGKLESEESVVHSCLVLRRFYAID